MTKEKKTRFIFFLLLSFLILLLKSFFEGTKISKDFSPLEIKKKKWCQNPLLLERSPQDELKHEVFVPLCEDSACGSYTENLPKNLLKTEKSGSVVSSF